MPYPQNGGEPRRGGSGRRGPTAHKRQTKKRGYASPRASRVSLTRGSLSLSIQETQKGGGNVGTTYSRGKNPRMSVEDNRKPLCTVQPFSFYFQKQVYRFLLALVHRHEQSPFLPQLLDHSVLLFRIHRRRRQRKMVIHSLKRHTVTTAIVSICRNGARGKGGRHGGGGKQGWEKEKVIRKNNAVLPFRVGS